MRPLTREPAPLPAAASAAWTVPLVALTPIFKGGANPQGIDEGRPFRGPSIRGHLRAWWRITSPETDPTRLYEAEEALFGGVFGEQARVSALRLAVLDNRSAPRDVSPAEGLGYALWVKEQSKGLDARAFHAEGARATLHLSAPEALRPALDRALRAWILLGGAGSRSRRGLGALWSDALLGRPDTLDALQALFKGLSPPAAPRPWASLGGATLAFGEPRPTAMAALSAALEAMKALRSAKSPDKLGALHGDFKAIVNQRAPVPGRRAALGLPLPFQWKKPDGQRARAELNVAGHNRYPSPVLLRPLPLGRGYVPAMCALTLSTPLPMQTREGLRGELDPGGVRIFMEGLRTLGWTLHPLEHTP